jgi:hypothetical protein
MANLVRSLGYSLGKVHCGLIHYLCALHQEGNRQPFESFLFLCKSSNITGSSLTVDGGYTML